MNKQIESRMTVGRLIIGYKEHNPDGHFFDKDTLSWFGEKLFEMYVLKETKQVDGHECYVLSTLQHKYPGGTRRQHYYFDCETFEYIGAKEE